MTAAATTEKVDWIREAAGSRFADLELNTYAPMGPAQPASPLPALPPGWSTTAAGLLVSPPGRLTLADHRLDDQEGYLLLNSQGIPIVYATARPGYTLRNYLDKNLELRGVRQWRDDLRAFHMTVMEVRMVP